MKVGEIEFYGNWDDNEKVIVTDYLRNNDVVKRKHPRMLDAFDARITVADKTYSVLVSTRNVGYPCIVSKRYFEEDVKHEAEKPAYLCHTLTPKSEVTSQIMKEPDCYIFYQEPIFNETKKD